MYETPKTQETLKVVCKNLREQNRRSYGTERAACAAFPDTAARALAFLRHLRSLATL